MRKCTPIPAAQIVLTCKCDKSSMMTLRSREYKDAINFCRVFCGIKKP